MNSKQTIIILGCIVIALMIFFIFRMDNGKDTEKEEEIILTPVSTKIPIPTLVPVVSINNQNPYLDYCEGKNNENDFNLNNYIKCLSNFNDMEKPTVVPTLTSTSTPMPITTNIIVNKDEDFISETIDDIHLHTHTKEFCVSLTNPSQLEFYGSNLMVPEHIHTMIEYPNGISMLQQGGFIEIDKKLQHSPHGCR